MNQERQLTKQDDKNPFKDIGFVQFWVVSTIFWITFPASLALCYLTMGPFRTKQFVSELINDFFQTVVVILVVVCVFIYVIYHFVSGVF